MNKFEELLWKQLEEYKEKGDVILTPKGHIEDKEVLKDTRESEYVYKCFPLKNKKEKLHIILPKEDYEGWDSDKIYDVEGIPKITAIVKKRMYFATKEVVE